MFCNVLLSLITAPGRKQHYAQKAMNSGVKLLGIFIADSKKGTSMYSQSHENRSIKFYLRQALAMRLTCLSQEEFNHMRDLIDTRHGSPTRLFRPRSRLPARRRARLSGTPCAG